MTRGFTARTAPLAAGIAFALCALAGPGASLAFALTVSGVVRDHDGKPIE